jgi:prolyl-tRNA synthetase
MFAKWIQSYRDLPLLINQWANVVRWELRPRLFLRTAEFLWQEGHTAHATKQEAVEETMRMLAVYADFAENSMAMPVIQGLKTEGEKFPGAVHTYCIEAMMQDRKALQAGTSHFLGQNFAKASDIKFLDAGNQLVHAWTTSWGVSTRLIGGLIMTHGDDDGLVLPPRLAPLHVVILPITMKAPDPAAVLEYCRSLKAELESRDFEGQALRVEVDARDLPGGDKNWEWIKKGVPVRLEVGPRDMAQDAVFMARRDKGHREKQSVPRSQFVATLPAVLTEIQNTLLQRALDQRKAHTRSIDSKDEFYAFFTPDNQEQPEIHGGFALTHWSGDPAVEEAIRKDLGVTVRCVPFASDLTPVEPGACPFTGKPSAQRVVWAKAY